MLKTAILITAFLGSTLPAAAETKVDPQAVAPFLDDRSFAVLHVDLTGIDVDALVIRLAALAQVEVKDLAQPRNELSRWLKDLTGAGARDLYLVASLIDVPDHSPFVVVPLEKGADANRIREALTRSKVSDHLRLEALLLPGLHFSGLSREDAFTFRYETIGGAMVGGSDTTRKRLRTLKALARQDLSEALASTGGVAQLVLAPTVDTRKVFEEIMPVLPAEVGGGSIQVVTRGLKWTTVHLDLAPLSIHLTIQATDDTAAGGLGQLLTQLTKLVAQHPMVREHWPDLAQMAARVKAQREGARVRLVLKENELASVLSPYVRSVRAENSRALYGRNLQQILRAMHAYEEAHSHFPAAAVADKKDRPLLSWRVALLPYLDQSDLYKQFHLEEPWDSEHNKKLIARMPAVFRSSANPKLAQEGKTTYLAPLGEQTMFPANRGVRIFEVTDGTSNTILLVDADEAHAVIWTKPDDLRYDPKEPARGLSTRHPDGYLTGFADGSIHFLPAKLDKTVLHALFTRQGGEVVDFP
jgi:hypothetical protein